MSDFSAQFSCSRKVNPAMQNQSWKITGAKRSQRNDLRRRARAALEIL